MMDYREEFLMHHGIKGQKWGVRRWQNSDGTFNDAGKKRYFSDGGSSAGGNARRALAKVYDINAKFYAKNGRNKTLASMNAAARDEQLKKAAVADKAKAEKKALADKAKADKITSKIEKQKAAVDVSIAKNSATRRVAEDYHRLTDREFAGKYQTNKKTFAKRYQKTKGDTYSLGLKKQARAIAFLNAMNGKSMTRTAADIAKATALSNAEQKALDKGHEYTAATIAALRDYSLRKL